MCRHERWMPTFESEAEADVSPEADVPAEALFDPVTMIEAESEVMSDAEDAGSMHLASVSKAADQEADENLAFERDVVKLFASGDTTAAQQYLQSKGFCLMPIALASAISNHKDSSASIAATCIDE
ncbi:hypothetical protein KSP40_PGU016897 [Platanthera guangdongensis]|uniref:Uncharacterized protein n=1 Tax=Platanthera guangdongensis TaxID=2320717 RepID=A0ABR2N363_9ASPA